MNCRSTDMRHNDLSDRLIPDSEYIRENYLGSSNAAAVLGLGAYGATPLTVYQEKTGQATEETDHGRELFLRRRKRWEGPIVEMLREEFDGQIVAVNRRYRDREDEFLAAEIDFEWLDHDGSVQNGEIKTVSPFAFGERHGWGDEGSDEIPIHYACQSMDGLMVTRRRACIIAAMVGLDSMIFYRLDRDEEVIAQMRIKLRDFWHNNVLARVPPEPLNLEDCKNLLLRMRGRPVEVDDHVAGLLDQYRQIKSSQKILDDQEKDIRLDILKFINRQWAFEPEAGVEDNAVLLRGGVQLASYNLQRSTRIDVTTLKEEAPEIAEKFSKTSQTRVLRLKAPKKGD